MNHLINNLVAALNGLGAGFCDYAGRMFVQAGLLIVALLVTDLLIRKRVRATFRYWMWMLVFIKLLLPPTLSLPTGIGYWLGNYFAVDPIAASQPPEVTPLGPTVETAPSAIGQAPYEPVTPAVSDPPIMTATADSSVAPSLNALTWQGILFGIWVLGVLVITALLVQRVFFVRGLITQSEPANGRWIEVLDQCRQQLGLRRQIELRISHNVTSPAVCGLFRPVILVPKRILEQLSRERLRAVLIHELAHIKRGDLWINCVQTFLQIAYFYNPFVWLTNVLVRRIREQAVDEMVLVALGAGAGSYSNTLIDVAEMTFSGPALSLRLVGVVESKKALEGRIKHMLNRPMPKSVKLGILGLMTVLMLGMVLLPMARAQKQSVDNTSAVLDSDKDGLENKLEAELGTNPKSSDTDGDGLSDYEEYCKYRTDPTKTDSDGDGKPDNDWNERREYAYSVRTVLRFMPPFDKAALNDDYQDARVLEKTDHYIEVEVIHYPLATTHESREENPNWQRDYVGMTKYLESGATTNWDAKMRQDLLAELKTAGIRIDELTDKEVVEQVSSWLMKRSRSLDKVFTTYYVHFPNGQPTVYPGLEGAFEREFGRDKENYDWTMDRHFDHELLGKGMFYNKTHGSCTSFAIYLTTVLRALGIPTRMILVVPAADPSDREQLMLVNKHITHNKVREIMLAGLRRVPMDSRRILSAKCTLETGGAV